MSAALWGTLYFLVPLALTMAVEALIGALFRLTFKEQRLLLLVNAVTNPSVSLLLYLCRYYLPRSDVFDVFAVALLEAAVVFAEWRLMRRLFDGKRRFFLLSLACNAASFSAGLMLTLILF